jgi:D-xylose transport system ATP-binding protein
MQPLLVARGVSKRFGAVEALVDVEFEVDAGINGRKVRIRTLTDATRAGIATVYQDLALCDNLDVVANLYLGSELVEPGVGQVRRSLDETAMVATITGALPRAVAA